MLCPCGSTEPYNTCCLAIINGEKAPNSPEQLMRTRYSAYAMKNAQYIYDTYAQSSQRSQSINEISSWINSCQWLKLTIHHSSCFDSLIKTTQHNNVLPTVEFTALYLSDNKIYQMTEKSRFIQEISVKPVSDQNKKQWLYLDGKDIEHKAIAIIKRNDPCPCAINKNREVKKKYKKCCGQ